MSILHSLLISFFLWPPPVDRWDDQASLSLVDEGCSHHLIHSISSSRAHYWTELVGWSMLCRSKLCHFREGSSFVQFRIIKCGIHMLQLLMSELHVYSLSTCIKTDWDIGRHARQWATNTDWGLSCSEYIYIYYSITSSRLKIAHLYPL